MNSYCENVLSNARTTYGYKNQIMVCIEELNELACVLAKYPRYDDHNAAVKELRDKVIDEVSDVTVILDHVNHIFRLTDDEVETRVAMKVARVERWLEKSSSQQQTIYDRRVDPKNEVCGSCQHYANPVYGRDLCETCFKNMSIEGNKPLYKPKIK